jgi:hypothetical protein
MAKQKSIFRKLNETIKAGATAVADVAQAAIISASDLPEGGGFQPVKKQRWVREIEATPGKPAKKASTKKKSKKKSAKRVVKKSNKKSKKKKL